jgi:hypothetical protein
MHFDFVVHQIEFRDNENEKGCGILHRRNYWNGKKFGWR